jgi:putative Holliday junction resolvase
MRILAVDFGDVHTGVSISDPTGFLASNSMTINSRNMQEVARQVLALAHENGCEELVVGYPRNMNGTVGERAKKCEDFAHLLEAGGAYKVILWDERLTSVDANRILSDAGKKRKKQKQLVDAVAASLILQNYLDSRRS